MSPFFISPRETGEQDQGLEMSPIARAEVDLVPSLPPDTGQSQQANLGIRLPKDTKQTPGRTPWSSDLAAGGKLRVRVLAGGRPASERIEGWEQRVGVPVLQTQTNPEEEDTGATQKNNVAELYKGAPVAGEKLPGVSRTH